MSEAAAKAGGPQEDMNIAPPTPNHTVDFLIFVLNPAPAALALLVDSMCPEKGAGVSA